MAVQHCPDVVAHFRRVSGAARSESVKISVSGRLALDKHRDGAGVQPSVAGRQKLSYHLL